VTGVRSRAVKGAIALGGVIVLGLAYAYGGRLFGDGSTASVSVTGAIEATQVDVSVKIAGRIIARLVNEGDRVTEGQVLVRLDPIELQAEVNRQEAAVRTADATLRDLLAGARPEEISEARASAARARAQLDDLLAGSRAQEIEDARAAARSAEATRQMRERELQRIDALYRRELVAQQDVDRAREAFEVASAQERSAREKLAMIVEGPRRHQIEAARAELAAAEQRLALLLAGSRPEQIQAARGQVAQAESALAMAKSRLKEAVVLAPINGVVLRKNLEVGETANPGASILTLMNPSEVWVRAYVAEEEVGRIKVGESARVSVDAYPERSFAGRVSEISSEAEFTPRNVQTKKERVNLVFRIKILLDNPQGILKPGMPADAHIG
jgi:HlyD family secretion protein